MDARTSSCTGTLSTTTLYLNDPMTGAMSEKVGSDWHDFLHVDGQIVAERFCTGSAPCTTGAFMRYFTLDHLNSIVGITDDTGTILEQHAYDPWGRERNLNGTDASTCPPAASLTSRGFTGHEMLSPFCEINANARIYDPTLGRFLAADTVVPDPFNGQSLNRYAYLENNPLAGTDPTGHDPLDSSLLAAPGFSYAWAYGPPMTGNFTDAMGGTTLTFSQIMGPSPACETGCWYYPPDISWSIPGAVPETIVVLGPRPVWQMFDCGHGCQTVIGLGSLLVGGPQFAGAVSHIVPTRGTIQLGYSGSYTLTLPGLGFGASGNYSVGVVEDAHGSVGVYGTVGGAGAGSEVGESESSGLTIQLSDAPTGNDLKAGFANGSLTIGDGIGGSIDAFSGDSPDGPVIGGGFTFGEAGGISGSVGGSYTGVYMFP